jgi:hypothetical protein
LCRFGGRFERNFYHPVCLPGHDGVARSMRAQKKQPSPVALCEMEAATPIAQ